MSVTWRKPGTHDDSNYIQPWREWVAERRAKREAKRAKARKSPQEKAAARLDRRLRKLMRWG